MSLVAGAPPVQVVGLMLAEAALQRALFFRGQWDKRRAHLNGSEKNNSLTLSPSRCNSAPKLPASPAGIPFGLVEFAWSPTRDLDEISRPSTSEMKELILSPSKKKQPGSILFGRGSVQLQRGSVQYPNDADSSWDIGDGIDDNTRKGWTHPQIPPLSILTSPKRSETPTSLGRSPSKQSQGPRPRSNQSITRFGGFAPRALEGSMSLPELAPRNQALQDQARGGRARTPKQELLSPTHCITWRCRSMLSRTFQSDDYSDCNQSEYSYMFPDDSNSVRKKGVSKSFTRFDDDVASFTISRPNSARSVNDLPKPPEDEVTIERRRSIRRSIVVQRRKSSMHARKRVPRASTKHLMDISPDDYEEHAVQAFQVLQLDPHDVLYSDIEPFLKYIGHREIHQEWVDNIIQQYCLGRATLDKEDAISIAVQYREEWMRYLEQKRQEDASNAGFRGHHKLLRSLTDTRLFPGAACEFLLTVSDGRRNSLRNASIEDILNMRDMIVDNAGFTPADHARIMNTFDRYDRDMDGFLTMHEFALALSWLGADVTFTRSAVRAHEKDSLLDQDSFLKEMKGFFEHEEERLSTVFNGMVEEQSGTENQGLLGTEHLTTFFSRMGHISATPEVINEVIVACGLTSKTRFLVEDAHRIYIKWQEHQGFLEREVQELNEAFDEFDLDGSGSMDAPELEVAIRWLGYPSPYQMVKDLVEEYDLDESGEVDHDEFRGFVARFRDNNMAEILNAFKLHDRDDSNTLDIGELRTALLQLGYVPSQDQTRVLMEANGGRGTALDVWEFHKLVQDFRIQVRDELRANQCFTDREVKQLRAKFKAHDPKDSGVIGNHNLAALIDELFPKAREDVDMHRKAKDILEQADQNHDGSINFGEFLHLMRLFQNYMRHEELEKERDALDNISLTNQEVKDLRRIFEMFDVDASGDLTSKELHEMLSGVLTITPRAEELLEKIRAVDCDGNRVLDFPEFLFFMQSLLEENWNNINNVSKAKADRFEREMQAQKEHEAALQAVKEKHSRSRNTDLPQNKDRRGSSIPMGKTDSVASSKRKSKVKTPTRAATSAL